MSKIARIGLLRERFRHFISAHRKLSITLGCLFLIILGATVSFLVLAKPKTVANKKPATVKVTKPVEKPKYYSNLTGNLVADQSATNQAVTAVMIENSPEARPQSGLKNSGLVFEAIAEGGITRFMVFYQQEKPQLIGPIRSVRLYDVDWLAAFDASLAHVGGSAAALSEVRNGSYRDIDQFFNANYYWRATDRYAPHNVYTNFEKLDALNATKGYKTSNFTGFKRADGKASEKPTASSIDVTISSDLYNSHYDYDQKTNTYLRSQAGEAHLDREGGQIAPSVVIVMKVNETTVMEDGYRQSITTIGSGEAVIFQNGTAISGTWTKNSKKDQIVFTDASGKEILLARGQTWITAVPSDGGGVVWK